MGIESAALPTASPRARRLRRPPGRLLPWFGLVLALAAIALIQRSAAPDGPLVDIHGDQDGARVPVGAPFTWTGVYLINAGSQPVVIDRVALGPHSSNVRMLYVRLPDVHTKAFGMYDIGPGVPPMGESIRVAGAAIDGGPEHGGYRNVTKLDVVLRASSPGLVLIKGMVVGYHVGDRHYTERIGPIMGACAPKPGHTTCSMPGLVPW